LEIKICKKKYSGCYRTVVFSSLEAPFEVENPEFGDENSFLKG
jgi:hypothetical protein